jgi:protein translocase SecG subunit
MNSLFILQTLTLINAIIVMVLVVVNQPQNDPAFGSKDSFTHTRRGFEQTLYKTTIFFSVLLVVLVLSLHIVK